MTAAGRQEVTLLALLLIGMMIGAAVSNRQMVLPAERAPFAEFEPSVLDINTSHWAQLTMIDGVGVATAKRIDEERERGGAFVDANDLARRVRGISPAAAERMWIDAPPRD